MTRRWLLLNLENELIARNKPLSSSMSITRPSRTTKSTCEIHGQAFDLSPPTLSLDVCGPCRLDVTMSGLYPSYSCTVAKKLLRSTNGKVWCTCVRRKGYLQGQRPLTNRGSSFGLEFSLILLNFRIVQCVRIDGQRRRTQSRRD